MDLVHHNTTAKYAVLIVLACAISIGLSRNMHSLNAMGLLNDMFVTDNWVNWAQLGIVVLTMIFIALIDSNAYTRNSYYYELLLLGFTAATLMT